MAKPIVIKADQLVGDLAKRLGIPTGVKKTPLPRFTKDQIRRHSIIVLGSIRDLDQAQRARVLAFATRLNSL